jgi:hypothetical protein
MLIQATKKLRDELNLDEFEPEERPPVFSWHANLKRINRRKSAVLVNDACAYTVVLYGLKKNDFLNFPERVKEGIKNSLIDKYLNEFKDFTFQKTRNRKYVGRLSQTCRDIEFHEDEFNKYELNYKDQDFELAVENEVKLKEVLPARIKYIYDYGDNWQHYIETEEIIEDYNKNTPTFLEGEGTAPPEDVGGVGGFSEFMRIISNPDHEEYESMLEWAESQMFKKYDPEDIKSNLRLYIN